MKYNKLLIPALLTVSVMTGSVTLTSNAEGSNFVSKGQIQSGDIFFDSSDFFSVYEQIESVKKEAYDLGNQFGEISYTDVSFYGSRNIADLIPAGTSFLGAGILRSTWGYRCWDNGTFGFNSYLSYNNTTITVSSATCTVRIWYSNSNGEQPASQLADIDLNYDSVGVMSYTNVVADTSDFAIIENAVKEAQVQAYEKGKSSASLKYVDVSAGWGTKNISSYIPEGATFVGAGCTNLYISYYSYDNGGVSIYGYLGYDTSNNTVSISGSASLPFAGAPNNRVTGGSGTVRIFYKE